MAQARFQSIQESKHRLKGLILSGRFPVEVNEILEAGHKLLELTENDKTGTAQAQADNIMAAVAVLAISFTQEHRHVSKRQQQAFNKEFGTRGLYSIGYSELTKDIRQQNWAEKISIISTRIRAKAIPFEHAMFAGTGFFNTDVYKISGLKDRVKLYQIQEKERQKEAIFINLRKMGRWFLFAVSALFVIPAFFTYRWVKRENAVDDVRKNAPREIQKLELSAHQYSMYQSLKMARKVSTLSVNVLNDKISDKPKKLIQEDKDGNATIYLDSKQRIRFDYFFQDIYRDIPEMITEHDYMKALPVTSTRSLARS